MSKSICLILLTLLASVLSGTSIQAQTQSDIYQLTQTPAVSGYEQPLVELLKRSLPANVMARQDRAGNLLVTLGNGAPHRLLVAPLDEFGYVISEIRDDGFLRIHPVISNPASPLHHQFYEGQPIAILTEKGTVSGVIGVRSTHLHRSINQAEAKPAQLDELWVDIGARNRAEVESAGVRLLDAITLRERATLLGKNQVAGVAAATRAEMATVLALIHSLSEQKLTGRLTIAFVTQDLFGRRGIDLVAQSESFDEVLLLTDPWTASRTPTNNKPAPEAEDLGRVGVLGQGPLVAQGDQLWSKGVQAIANLKTRLAPYTEGPQFSTNNVHVIALPVAYGGTTVETVDLRDAQQLHKLLLEKLAPGATSLIDKSFLPAITPKPSSSNSILAQLVESYGVSTFEEPVAETVKKLLPAWAKPETDSRGNVIVTIGSGKPHIVFAAHMDEIGYIINSIGDDGSAQVARIGGFYETLFEAHTVLVHHGNQQIKGIMLPRPRYHRATNRNILAEELRLYFGTSSRSETEALGIKVGDSITVPKHYYDLQSKRATGRSFDDRVGSAALIMALQQLKPEKLKCKVSFVWTVEEETGLDGAKVFAEKAGRDTDYVFAVDTFVSADAPLESSRFADGKIGQGAVVRAMDNSNITPREMLDKVLAIAKARKIAIQYGVTGGGNDGAVFTRYGAIDIPLSWPLRYSHSPAEVIDLRDLDALADLVRALAEDFAGK